MEVNTAVNPFGLQRSLWHKEDISCPKKINSQLSSLKTKHVGLVNLHHLLVSCSEDAIIDNATTWIKQMTQIILQSHERKALRQLAAVNLHHVLKYSSQIPASCREISSSLASNVLDNILQSSVEDQFPVLKAMESLLKTYPSSCGSLRTRVVKHTLPLMSSCEEKIQTLAIRCWAQVPFLGGGGSQRSTHALQWEGQLEQAIQALNFTYQNFIGSDVGSDPSLGSLSLPFPCLPVTEPQVSYTLIQRISTLSECLIHLLNLQFPTALSIPVEDVMTLVLDVLELSPSSMGNTTEMRLRASCLHIVHTSVLKLLSKLCQICRRNLCRYSSAINRIFSVLLDLWKDPAPIPGRHKKHCVVRTQIFKTAAVWIEMCGVASRFLCGLPHQNLSIQNHIIDDITPMKRVLQISAISDLNEKVSKAKRRKLGTANISSDPTSGHIKVEKANSLLCVSALQVLTAVITTMGSRLSPEIHKSLQESVVKILLQLEQGKKDVVPYQSSSDARLRLYKLLLTLTKNPSAFWPPPLSLSVRILKFALHYEHNLLVKNFCSDALTSICNIVHPWRTSWHRCSVNLELHESKPLGYVDDITLPALHVEAFPDKDQNSNPEIGTDLIENKINSIDRQSNCHDKSMEPNVADNVEELIDEAIQDVNFDDAKDDITRDLPQQMDEADTAQVLEEKEKETYENESNDKEYTKTKQDEHPDKSNEMLKEDFFIDNKPSADVENMLLDFVDLPPDDDNDHVE